MIQEFPYNQIVVPMTEIWRLWEREKKVTLSWFFDLLEGFIDPRPILYFVDLDSVFFQTLHREFKQRNICPEYIIPADDFLKNEFVSELLEDNVHLSLLIFKPLGPEVVERVKSLENFIHQLKFVVLARKDWDFENTYRSIPHFMRSRLFIDFPISLHPGDFFLSPHEWIPVIQSFRKQFPGLPIKSYCPNLFFYNEFLSSNISHFSGPHKLNSGKKYLTCILKNYGDLKTIMGSETMIRNSEQVEILLTGTDEKNNPMTFASIHSYQVYPKDPEKPVSEALVSNFLASRAKGQYLLFLDKETVRNFESLLNSLFNGSFDEFGFLIPQKAMIFRRDDFLRTGGFDPLFTDKSPVWLDSLFRYGLFKNRDFNYEAKQSGNQWNGILHKYACEEKFRIYLSESDFQFLSKEKLRENSDKTGVNIHFQKPCHKDGFFKKCLKIIFIPILKGVKFCNQYKNSWSLVFYRLYGFIFYLLYPVRKIYYFCEFQYEKRVLGLHIRGKSESDL